MAIKTKDGLVHHVNRPETESAYGKTACDRGFTVDPNHIKMVVEGQGWDDIVPAKLSKKPLTCLQCVSASSA
jgi:hypothetical protein